METYYKATVSDKKPLRDGPGGNTTGVVLNIGATIYGDIKENQWIRLVDPYAGYWITTNILSNLTTVEVDDTETSPEDTPTGTDPNNVMVHLIRASESEEFVEVERFQKIV